MAYLDMGDVLSDPEISDPFIVKRRAESFPANGRGETKDDLLPAYGVITAAHPNDLERLDDAQRMGRNLSIVTRFRLQGPSDGVQADQVVWQGNTFIVHVVEPYAQYGEGWIQAIVGSIQTMDNPAPPPPVENTSG